MAYQSRRRNGEVSIGFLDRPRGFLLAARPFPGDPFLRILLAQSGLHQAETIVHPMDKEQLTKFEVPSNQRKRGAKWPSWE